MSAQIRDLTTDLRQLLAAATPGPFTVASDTGAFANLQSLHRLAPGKDGWRERVVSNVRSADAALIAGVLNALPVLLDALDEAEEARARVAELEAQQQPRVITDPEELSALPAGALVHDGTAVFDHLGAGWWVTTGSADPIHSEAILETEPDGTCGCTVIVLRTPRQEGQADA